MVRDFFFAWLIVKPALIRDGFYNCFNTTEFEAIRLQSKLGGPRKVVYEKKGKDVVFFSTKFPKENRTFIMEMNDNFLKTME